MKQWKDLVIAKWIYSCDVQFAWKTVPILHMEQHPVKWLGTDGRDNRIFCYFAFYFEMFS